MNSFSSSMRFEFANLLIALGVIVLSACNGAGGSGSNGSTSDIDANREISIVLQGAIQKGPFIQGTQITIQELDDNLNPTGRVFITSTFDDLGAFSVPIEVSSAYVDIFAEGYYFNEVSNELSGGSLFLKAISELNENSVQFLNVNLLTTLQYDRVKYLHSQGLSFSDAKYQASVDVLRIFHIDFDSFLTASTNFEQLDQSSDSNGDAILIAASSIMQFGNSEAELLEMIANIGEDISVDGTLDEQTYINAIASNSSNLDANQIALNLQSRYEILGLSIELPLFAEFIDGDGSGYIDALEADPVIFSVEPGTYNVDILVELATDTIGATIHYTLDKSAPSESSPVYSEPIVISGDGTNITVTAIAVSANLMPSHSTTSTYNIDYLATDGVRFDPEGGQEFYKTYRENIAVELSTATAGATIHYTLDNSEPSVTSPIYSGPIEIVGDGTAVKIAAIAVAANQKPSNVNISRYIIDYPKSGAPRFSQLAGSYNENFDLVLSDTGAGSDYVECDQYLDGTIYFTLDGSAPTKSSSIFVDPGIEIAGNGNDFIVKAYTVADERKDSDIVTSYFRVDYEYEYPYQPAALDIDGYQNAIIGTWIGQVDTPWVQPYNVQITFNADGTYNGVSLSETAFIEMPSEDNCFSVFQLPAFYYGTDLDDPAKTYALLGVDAQGEAFGEIVISYGGDSGVLGSLRKINLSSGLDSLEFEFWHRNTYGPLNYKLIKIN